MFPAIYPLKGIYQFVTHREYWPLFGARLIIISAISIAVICLLFLLVYLPQVAFLMIFHGEGAWISALFLVLGEGHVLISLVFEAFFVEESLVDVFDATLIKEGQEHLVATHRVVDSSEANAVKSLGKHNSPSIYCPFSLRQTFEFIIFLPLNMIPIIGTPLFVFLTGVRAGPLHHHRYFQLMGFDKKMRSKECKERRWAYSWFGSVAVLLQMVPVFSLFFLLSTVCGSALWAADLERERHTSESGEDDNSPSPPPFTDSLI